jgi:predicted XRE-type DNA-binding protein
MSSTGDETIRALRSDVALQIARITMRSDTTQTGAARRLGIPQPTLSKIVNGRVSDISLELLIRVAVKAGLPISLHTGRAPEEAGAFVSAILGPAPPSPRSQIGDAARESLLQAERRLTPSQRLEAFLEHNQLLASLQHAGRAAELRRVQRARPGP